MFFSKCKNELVGNIVSWRCFAAFRRGNCADFRFMTAESRASDSAVVQAMCGVSSALSHPSSGLFGRIGSMLTTSAPKNPRWPLCSARATAASSTSAPRAVLIRTAPGFILANVASLIIPRVSSVAMQCSVTISLDDSSSSRGRKVTPSDAYSGRTVRVLTNTCIPKPCAIRATLRPMCP